MSHLATAFPGARRLRRLPISRDQAMLLLAAVNEAFLGLDTWIAHQTSGTIVPYEWIPIVFGAVAAALLLLAGLIAYRHRPLATIVATGTLLSSIAVGFLGAYFHFVRAILPGGPPGRQIAVDLFVWAPPILGPLAFALVGILGISAAWVEDPPDSGRLLLLGDRRLQLPYSKTRAYFFVTSMGTLVALISSVLDHARAQFENPWLWIPTAAGIFGTVVAAMLGAIERPTRNDLLTYVGAMLLLIAIGPIGTWLHVQANLVAQNTIVVERFLRGAPFLAPLLFSNMGLLGLIALLGPAERPGRQPSPASRPREAPA